MAKRKTTTITITLTFGSGDSDPTDDATAVVEDCLDSGIVQDAIIERARDAGYNGLEILSAVQS